MITRDQHMHDFVDGLVHGSLDSDDARLVEDHCDGCEECGQALEEARRLAETLSAEPPTEASEMAIRNTLAFIDTTIARRQANWNRFLKIAGFATAACVVCLLGAQAFISQLKPTPFDLRLLGQDTWITGSQATLRVALLNRESGRPIANVPVDLSLYSDGNEPLRLVSFTTTDGFSNSPKFAVPNLEDGSYTLIATAALADKPEVVTQAIKVRRSWKLMLSTDKPVYQPGQKILLRALALKQPHLKPIAGEETTFLISDPKGNVIFKQKKTSSRFGLTAAECELARVINEGPYEITCQVGDTTSSRTVTVEKYVLPKFKTDITVEQSFLQPGEQVRGAVQSDYFFGKPVAGAKVLLQAFTTDVERAKIFEREFTSNADGRVSFEFKLPATLIGREQTGGDAEISLFATVTDSAKQAQVAALDRIVTQQPLRLTIIPESATLVKGVSNTVYIHARFADGRPAKARLVIRGIDGEFETDDLGLAAVPVTPSSQDFTLAVHATSIDDLRLKCAETAKLSCGNHTNDYLVRTDKAVYNGGDTVNLDVIGGGVQPVFVDILKDGQSVLSETIEVSDGQGNLTIDLPAELFGALRLVTYRFSTSGLAVRKSRMLFVRKAGELKIDAALDRDEYRPGQTAKLKLRLSDEDGEPVQGAISLAAVDEAVFSVLQQSAGLAQTFFTLEKELLEPVYTIYDWGIFGRAEADETLDDANRPGENPGENRSNGNQIDGWERFEQALFAQTSHAVAGRRAVPRDFTNANNGRMRQAGWTDMADSFSLADNSFDAKRHEVEYRRRQGFRFIEIGWTLVVLSLFLTTVVATVIYRPIWLLVWLLVGLVVLFLASAFMVNQFTLARFAALDSAADFAVGLDSMVDNQVRRIQRSDLPRVREHFPETLLWRPEILTDENGEASLEVELADSITTWRVSSSAVSDDGRLGSSEDAIRVFQPFFVDMNLPVELTRGDEVGIPIVVYNYLDEPQSVSLEVESADWYEVVSDSNDSETDPDSPTKMSLELQPGEVKSINYAIRVLNVGHHEIQVTAQGSGGKSTDALKRSIDVVPNGFPVEQVFNGNLTSPVDLRFNVPEDSVPGSIQAIVKLHPSMFSQLMEGLDGIFKMPYGCFEQTSSTTYPNVLALEYLRRNQISNPKIEAKARQYIHLGYQRLLTFEVAGGGFDWYGRGPASESLTAYGLMEFEDMSRVHDVDQDLIDRTRQWLLSKQGDDGSWPATTQFLSAIRRRHGSSSELAHTAYIASAAFANGNSAVQSAQTLDYLLGHKPESIEDPYTLSLIVLAISSIDPKHASLERYVDQLESMKQSDLTKDQVWWTLPPNDSTIFYGSGESGSVEVTATAALALLKSGKHGVTVRRALKWIASVKDANGTWKSTQATIQALKALLAGTGGPLDEARPRRIELALNGELAETVSIPVDQSQVMQQRDLSSRLTAGDHLLRMTETSESSTNYQVMFRYFVENKPTPATQAPLAIELDYDRINLSVDQTATATVKVENLSSQTAPMVMLDLPIPAGFVVDSSDVDALVENKEIEKYEVTARQVIVYLLGLQSGETFEFDYQLQATMPVRVSVPSATVYEYYDPDKRAETRRFQVVVSQ